MSDIIEEQRNKTAFLDTVAARIIALAVAAGVGYLLYASHLHYQGVPGGMRSGTDRAEFEACIGARMAAFEKVAERAGYSDEQKRAATRAARSGANAICAEMLSADGGAAAEQAVQQ